MGLFKKEGHPTWASFLRPDDYVAFRQAVLEASKNTFDPNKANEQGMLLHGQAHIAIINLAAQCAELDRSDWAAEIKRWVEAFLEGFDRPQLRYPQDIPSLKLQLYPVNYFSQFDDDPGAFIYEETIPGVLTTVVVDWPDMVATLRDDAKKQWSAHKTRIITELKQKLAKDQPYGVTFIEMRGRDGETVAVIEDADIMTATHALVLGELYPQLIGKKGALVALPIRHMMLIKRLDAEPEQSVINAMKNMTRFLLERNQYAVSDKVYVWESGKFSEL